MATKTAAPRGLEPVGAQEIAERLDVSVHTVYKWQQRGDSLIGGAMPEPKWTVSGGSAWNWPDVYRWAKKSDRLPA